MSMHKLPPYFDYLIADFKCGAGNRYVHLGHWENRSGIDSGIDQTSFAASQARLDDYLLSMADIRDGQAIVDVGCGFGGTLATINTSHDNMRLTGINIDPRQLEICREILPQENNRLDWLEADACALPLNSNSVDRILCIEAMFHFSSRRKFFRETFRVLKPGGLLVASDILISESALQLDVPGFCLEAMLQDGYGPWPDFWSAEGDPGDIALAAGFNEVQYFDATEHTEPSHEATLKGEPDWQHDPGHPATRAALMLKWLHRNRHLRYCYFAFSKPV